MNKPGNSIEQASLQNLVVSISMTVRQTLKLKTAMITGTLRCVLKTVLAICVAGQALIADEELPTLDQMELESFEELMSAEPYDWVVLKNGGVIVTSMVFPRPDTLARIAAEKQELEKKQGGNRAERDARRNRLDQLKTLNINLPENQAEDFLLPVTQVKEVISFEELMLRRVDALLEEGDIAKAYEMMLRVDQRVPNWERSVPRFEQLLLREADIKLKDGKPYAALALLEELARRNVKNVQLPQVMGNTLNGLIQEAVKNENYPKAQYLIERLAKYFPNHMVSTGWKSKLQAQMVQKLMQAEQLTNERKFREAARIANEANRVWRTEGNQRAAYSRYVSRFQTLRVPVRRFFDEPVVSPVELEAEERHRELTTVSLFAPSGADELTYFQSSIFDIWDPRDLGREVIFSLRQTRPYWQSQPVMSANEIGETLSRMLNPDTDTFNPRLASFVREFSVRSPTELQISFHRVPLSLEALFRFPITAPPKKGEQAAEPVVLSKRFRLVDQGEAFRLYRREIAEPDGLNPSQYHIAEIEERKYATRHSEIQAFQRNEIDVLPHLMPWEIDIFKESGKAFVQQYAIPSTHVIVFNPRSESVRSAQLRRGLSFGVDRENMLKKIILRDPEMKYGRIASAPWHSESYASSPLVEEPRYDHYLSFLLRLAALEQLRIPDKQKFVADAKARAREANEEWDEEKFRFDNGPAIVAAAAHIQLPRLRMVCDSDPVVMQAAEQIVARWKLLKYDIELIPGDTEGEMLGDDDWDMMYRRTHMQEPLLDLWGLLLTDKQFDVDKLSGYPDWMRQELINLDYATSFLDAQKRLFQIHRHMAAQAFIIPLWELDDFVAFQRNIAGFQGRPLSVYHGVERWLVKP